MSLNRNIPQETIQEQTWEALNLGLNAETEHNQKLAILKQRTTISDFLLAIQITSSNGNSRINFIRIDDYKNLPDAMRAAFPVNAVGERDYQISFDECGLDTLAELLFVNKVLWTRANADEINMEPWGKISDFLKNWALATPQRAKEVSDCPLLKSALPEEVLKPDLNIAKWALRSTLLLTVALSIVGIFYPVALVIAASVLISSGAVYGLEYLLLNSDKAPVSKLANQASIEESDSASHDESNGNDTAGIYAFLDAKPEPVQQSHPQVIVESIEKKDNADSSLVQSLLGNNIDNEETVSFSPRIVAAH